MLKRAYNREHTQPGLKKETAVKADNGLELTSNQFEQSMELMKEQVDQYTKDIAADKKIVTSLEKQLDETDRQIQQFDAIHQDTNEKFRSDLVAERDRIAARLKARTDEVANSEDIVADIETQMEAFKTDYQDRGNVTPDQINQAHEAIMAKIAAKREERDTEFKSFMQQLEAAEQKDSIAAARKKAMNAANENGTEEGLKIAA